MPESSERVDVIVYQMPETWRRERPMTIFGIRCIKGTIVVVQCDKMAHHVVNRTSTPSYIVDRKLEIKCQCSCTIIAALQPNECYLACQTAQRRTTVAQRNCSGVVSALTSPVKSTAARRATAVPPFRFGIAAAQRQSIRRRFEKSAADNSSGKSPSATGSLCLSAVRRPRLQREPELSAIENSQGARSDSPCPAASIREEGYCRQAIHK